MPDTEKIHKLVQEEDTFEEFLVAVNDQQKFYELFVAVEGVGRETGFDLDLETIQEIDHFMIGWMRLLWEAHHGDPDQVRDPSFRDVFFRREVG